MVLKTYENMHIGCRILISEITNLYFQRETSEYKYDRRTYPNKRNLLSLNVLSLRRSSLLVSNYHGRYGKNPRCFGRSSISAFKSRI